MSFFNIYETTEPLAYYSRTRNIPQNLLILENKDTFFSMRRHLLEGNEEILGIKIDTLIYGAGKGIFRSFEDFDLCVEPYMQAEGNQILKKDSSSPHRFKIRFPCPLDKNFSCPQISKLRSFTDTLN